MHKESKEQPEVYATRYPDDLTISDTQQRLEMLNPSDDNYRPLLYKLLSHQDLKPHIHSLDRPGLEGFIELLDKVGKVDADVRQY